MSDIISLARSCFLDPVLLLTRKTTRKGHLEGAPRVSSLAHPGRVADPATFVRLQGYADGRARRSCRPKSSRLSLTADPPSGPPRRRLRRPVRVAAGQGGPGRPGLPRGGERLHRGPDGGSNELSDASSPRSRPGPRRPISACPATPPIPVEPRTGTTTGPSRARSTPSIAERPPRTASTPPDTGRRDRG